MNLRSTGNVGEEIAKEFLLTREYIFIQKNFETPYGEIDLIMMKEKDIYFFEVKFRKNYEYGFGDDSISTRKIERLRKSIEVWISLNGDKFEYENIFLDGIVIDPDGQINRYTIY